MQEIDQAIFTLEGGYELIPYIIEALPFDPISLNKVLTAYSAASVSVSKARMALVKAYSEAENDHLLIKIFPLYTETCVKLELLTDKIERVMDLLAGNSHINDKLIAIGDVKQDFVTVRGMIASQVKLASLPVNEKRGRISGQAACRKFSQSVDAAWTSTEKAGKLIDRYFDMKAMNREALVEQVIGHYHNAGTKLEAAQVTLSGLAAQLERTGVTGPLSLINDMNVIVTSCLVHCSILSDNLSADNLDEKHLRATGELKIGMQHLRDHGVEQLFRAVQETIYEKK